MIAEADPPARLVKVLLALDVPRSSWYHHPVPADERRRKGPPPEPIPDWMRKLVKEKAEEIPILGYKKIAIICRREGHKSVSNKKVYRIFKEEGLLAKPQPRNAELYQAAKLFELLPSGPNDLWQTDVTYIHIPGHGWWYAVTVIDYFSRYLLACHLTDSCSAAACTKAIDIARANAEAIHGPMEKTPFLVTDNGPSFIARRFRGHIHDVFRHVRIRYRTPTQLGLLERFHESLKREEIYYHMYDNPGHCRDRLEAYREFYNNVRPHWSLVPKAGGDVLTPEDVYRHGLAIKIPKWQGWARAARAKLDEMMAQDAA
jgi:transposase InsO family protein